MRTITTLFAAATMLSLGATSAPAQQPAPGASATPNRIEAIRARGNFRCGVYENVPGLATLDAQGRWQGFDVDFCRAMGAAFLGSGEKVEFVKMNFAQGIPAVRSGEIDMAALAITVTVQRETELGLDFIGPTLYSGHAFMVHKRSGATKLADLDGATICIVAGTITDSLIADYFRARNMTFKPVAIETSAQMMPLYEEGRCDVVTLEPPFLATRRARLRVPSDHLILPEFFAKSDMGPVVRGDDLAFSQAARLVHWAVVTAEEMGITQANVEAMARDSRDPAIRRFLGVEGNLGSKAGLSDRFTIDVIKAVGNYAEIWERSYGKPYGLDRGPNRLARDGGQQWAPLWR
jgi:general L-amino acid transport system substrate-binding protein